MGLSSPVIRGLLSKGVLMGIVHVLSGPDHMSALATMTSGQSWQKAFFAGIRWGIGHSVGLIVIAIVFFALKGGFDLDEIGVYCDYIVGVLMIGLGLWTMGGAILKRREADEKAITDNAEKAEKADLDAKKAEQDAQGAPPAEALSTVNPVLPTQSEAVREGAAVPPADDSVAVVVKPHVDKKPKTAFQRVAGFIAFFHHHHHHHDHGASAQAATGAGAEEKKEEPKTWCQLFKERMLAFLVGLVHGIAGPGGILGVLPAVQMNDGWMATIYLGTFCIMSDLTMGVVGALYGELTRRAGKNHARLDYYLNVFSASLSLIVGVLWIVLHAMGKLEAVFHR